MDESRSIFLWGPQLPAPDTDNFNPRSANWWEQYATSLRVPPGAARELAESSRRIASLLPDPEDWATHPRPFRGLVVGAVQSGKTASMIGVSAVALDQGFRIIIVLAGTKDDLRQQTARRFNTQLLRQCDPIPGSSATTLGTPTGPGPLGGFALPYSVDASRFNILQVRVKSALSRGEPCVLIIKKHSSSLAEVRAALMWSYERYGVDSLPTLILDDECDDASVESSDTTIPAAIANLWHAADRPLAAYVGYTATSAANLLQRTANELYPSNFVTLLRFPGPEETPLQYTEPLSDNWYSGGDCFYKAFGDDSFLTTGSVSIADLVQPPGSNPSLADAIRAFFVSAAMRLALAPERSFANPESYPRPHSMLVQTSPDTNDHLHWANGISDELGGEFLPDRSTRFDVHRVLERISAEEEMWRKWFDRFEASRERIYDERPHEGVQKVLTWDQVKNYLAIAIEHSRLKIINSDPEVGASLDFEPRLDPSGRTLPPQDCLVIVIGGAKLSRGLTIDGLCISYFARWASTPSEDTVLQLSRWFGYRGPYLEFCRLFTLSDVRADLGSMHDNDTDLRLQLAALMGQRRSPQEAVLVIQANPRSLPTAKMGDGVLLDIAFSPFNGVLRHVEVCLLAEANEETAAKLVQRVRGRSSHSVRTSTGKERGLLSRGWDVAEIASVLDSLNYTAHNPEHEETAMRRYYRPADQARPRQASFAAIDDAYQIAAYLRAWAAAAEDDSAIPGPPAFNVAISFGEMKEDNEPFDFPLTNRLISPDGRVVGGWTGRSANWPGDAFFDDPPVQLRIGNSYSRLLGADGLLLLYIIHRSAQGRSGQGVPRIHHSPIFCISIPEGGPPFRRILTRRP